MKNPDYRKRVSEQGAYPNYMTPDELNQLVVRELAEWGKVIHSAGIVIE